MLNDGVLSLGSASLRAIGAIVENVALTGQLSIEEELLDCAHLAFYLYINLL